MYKELQEINPADSNTIISIAHSYRLVCVRVQHYQASCLLSSVLCCHYLSFCKDIGSEDEWSSLSMIHDIAI